VSLEVAGDAERPLAVFALVGLLSRVCPKVTCQVGRPGEHLSAELAGVSVLELGGSVARVGSQHFLVRLGVGCGRAEHFEGRSGPVITGTVD
jgi:hypothetical protein